MAPCLDVEFLINPLIHNLFLWMHDWIDRSDTYCYIDQCGASTGSAPVGHALFPPQRDAEFSRSIGGMIWPRGFVGAAAFWNYNSSADPASPAFVLAIDNLNDQLQARGSYTCPSNCSCDQLTACGQPYIKPVPPSAGAALSLQSCQLPAPLTQALRLGSDGRLVALGNSSLCVQGAGAEEYPLRLKALPAGDCDQWEHMASGNIMHQATGSCMDVRVTYLLLHHF